MLDPRVMTDALERVSGHHPGHRRAHARGRCFDATFHPSGEAVPFTTAAHLQHDPVPAVVRFSNTHGDPEAGDGGATVLRGMAVRFLAPETDLVAMNVPHFMAATPEAFLELTRLLTDKAVGSPERAAAVVEFVTAYPGSAPVFEKLTATPVPLSYATARFWAVHAFAWLAPDGTRRFVRYRWEPDAGFHDVPAESSTAWPAGYLTDELARRLTAGPVSFTLKVSFARPGDPTADPTRSWPPDRKEISAGTLVVTAPVADEAHWDAQVFDPTRLTPGIELSDDPVLTYRPQVYAESKRRRAGEIA